MNSQKTLQLPPVEPDDNFIVNGNNWDRQSSGSGGQFLAGLRILRDVLGRERDAV